MFDTSRLLCAVAPVGGSRSLPASLLQSPRAIALSSSPSLSNSASSAAGAANLVDDDSPLGFLVRAAAEAASGTSGTGREEEEADDYDADIDTADHAADDETMSEATGMCDAAPGVALHFPWLAGVLAATAGTHDARPCGA